MSKCVDASTYARTSVHSYAHVRPLGTSRVRPLVCLYVGGVVCTSVTTFICTRAPYVHLSPKGFRNTFYEIFKKTKLNYFIKLINILKKQIK